jgi:hypothetical protein
MLKNYKELGEEPRWITDGLHEDGCDGRLGADYVRLLAAFNTTTILFLINYRAVFTA